MIFSRKQPDNQAEDRQNKKRIVSDIRPAYGKLPTMPKRKAPPVEKPREIFTRGPQPSAPKNPVIKKSPPKAAQAPPKMPPPPRKTPPLPKSNGSSGFRPTRMKVLTLLTPVAIILVLGVYFVWSSSLTLEITPKKTAFDITNGVQVELPAELFTASVTKRGEGTSQDEENFTEKATGTIIVYNNFNSQTQILVKNTRFESPEGLVYKTTSRIEVPGKKGDTPGTTEVTVIASEAGDEYNIGLTDFTIPGFAGGPKFQGFYGRSKTDMIGGKTGYGKVFGQDEAEEILATLESEMAGELESQIGSVVPDTHLSFPETYEPKTVVRITDPPVGSPADEFFAEVRGEIETLGIHKDKFSDELAELLFKEQYAQGAYKLREDGGVLISDVRMNMELGTITMTISGKATFEWTFDEVELQNKVLEASNHKDLKAIFDSYPGISRVEQIFRPAVLKRVPNKANRLHIKINP